METKFKLQLGTIESLDELKSVITNGLTREFITDMTRTTLRSYQKDLDISALVKEFDGLLSSNYNRTYAHFNEWSVAQMEHVSDIMMFVTRLDERLASVEKTAQGDVVAEFQSNLMNFLASLNTMNITESLLDIGQAHIKEEYVKNILEELAIVNEANLLSMVISLKLDITPVDVSKNKNQFIESKLASLNKLINACNKLFDNDLEKVNDKILSMYEKFYNICYETLTDGEKAEKARKVMKQINPHRQMLDKLENKLTEAHELSRQLAIHKNKLAGNIEALTEDSNNRIAENPSQKETVTFELESAKYVANNYVNQIDDAVLKLDTLKDKIAEHYNVLDRLEIALKSAIPSENDMKKYSSIAFKLQELGVRLDMSKSQVTKGDKEIQMLITTVNSGLKTMIAYAVDVKDLYLRNSLMTASFKAVNAMYEVIDGSLELARIKSISDEMLKYTEMYNSFADELVEYRKVGNNVIRDVSIIMGKQISGVNLLEIINILENGIKKIDTMYDSLTISNEKQKELLESILAL